MTPTEAWLLQWFADHKGFHKGTHAERLVTDIFASGLLDSFGVMELVAEIESRFGVVFDNDHFQDRRFKTMTGLAQMVQELTSSRGAA